MDCNKCKTSQKAVTCDSCKKGYCKACSGLTASEIKVMELKERRVLKFYCKTCDSIAMLQRTIEDKVNIILGKDEIIDLLRQKIVLLEKNIDLGKSKQLYSQIVQHPSQLVRGDDKFFNNVPNIVIKPKNQQSNEKTRNDLLQTIKPEKLKLAVKSTKAIRNGGIVVKCNSRDDMMLLKEEATRKLMDYTVDSTRMRKPRFKIVGYEGDLNLEQIRECIAEQNHLNSEDDYCLTFMRHNKKSKTNTIYGECSPSIFHRLIDLKKIFIQWQRCPIYEDINIQRCFKCQQHYHKSGTCQNNIVCEFCAGGHNVENCPKTIKRCRNCVDTNTKHKLGYNIEHAASDPECPSFLYLLNVLRSRTDYGCTHVYGP